MALHPTIQEMLTVTGEAKNRPLSKMTLEAIRKSPMQSRPLAGEPQPLEKIMNHIIHLDEGNLLMRLYYPTDAEALPTVLAFHPGGFVKGDIESYDPICRSLALASKALVISINYPRAPEAPFPKALQAAKQAFHFIATHPKEIGSNGKLALFGEDAGGNLVVFPGNSYHYLTDLSGIFPSHKISPCLMDNVVDFERRKPTKNLGATSGRNFRERPLAAVLAHEMRAELYPPLLAQVLVTPILDLTFSSLSHQEYGKGYLLEHDSLLWYRKQYIKDWDPTHPHISPLYAQDLSTLPPTLILSAECDPVTDEGIAYAQKLRAAGFSVTQKILPGMVHGFFQMGGVIDEGSRAIETVGEFLQKAFT